MSSYGAFTNPVTLRSGSVATYWYIDALSISWTNKLAQISYSLWQDQITARSMNTEPMDRRVMQLLPSQFDTYFAEGVPNTALLNSYAAIRALDPDAAGAMPAPLMVGTGSFVLTGQDILLRYNSPLLPQNGNFVFFSRDVELLVTRLPLSAGAGNFTLTGQAVTLTKLP